MAQFSLTHCGATIVSGIGAEELRTVPSEELAISNTEHQPVIAVRIFHGVHPQFRSIWPIITIMGMFVAIWHKIRNWRKEHMPMWTSKVH